MTKNTQRGGARAGAGAKPQMQDGKRVQVYLDSQSHKVAAKMGSGNVSLGVRIALACASKNGDAK